MRLRQNQFRKLCEAAVKKHLGETDGQIERLEQIFALMGKPAKGKKCPAIDGILEEGSEIMQEHEQGAGLDAARGPSRRTLRNIPLRHYDDVGNRTWV